MTNEDSILNPHKPDPTVNVKEMIGEATGHLDNSLDRETHRIDHAIEFETKRVDEKFAMIDTKYQIQFTAAEKAIGIASTAQEKLVAQALDGTKEAINKAEIATDKRFQLLSEKIDGVSDVLSKNAGAQGIYVTHDYLNNAFDKFRIDMESILKPIATKLADVTTFMNSAQGTGKGRQDMYGWIVGGVMFLIAVTSFIIQFSS